MKGTTIKKRLSETGTKQTELARLLGITPQAVAGIFAASDVRTGTVERICNALNLPLSFFYGDENTVLGNLGSIGEEKANGK
ncbi:MAG: helix-turn-helix domain-containing protein, partial [Bacteroidales bacterium]|nr:helix-turn-helix domain-containing protein [Bacteroidales bacterium]